MEKAGDERDAPDSRRCCPRSLSNRVKASAIPLAGRTLAWRVQCPSLVREIVGRFRLWKSIEAKRTLSPRGPLRGIAHLR